MQVKANVFVLGKLSKPWKDKEGVEHNSCSINVMQNNGEIVDKLRLTQEQFNKVEANKTYAITADFGTGSNGGYLHIVDIAEIK